MMVCRAGLLLASIYCQRSRSVFPLVGLFGTLGEAHMNGLIA